MKKINKILTNDMVTSLKELIGTTFIAFKADPFQFTNTVFGQVELISESGSLYINNRIHVIDYFGSREDICFLDVSKEPSISGANSDELIVSPINREIKEIHLVQEKQVLMTAQGESYDLQLTRGMIFVMSDDYDLPLKRPIPSLNS